MKNIWIILKNELKSYIMTKGFIISCIGLPLLIIAVIAIPTLSNKYSAQENADTTVTNKITISDPSNALYGLGSQSSSVIKNYSFSFSTSSHDQLKKDLMDKRIDNYLLAEKNSENEISITLYSSSQRERPALKEFLNSFVMEQHLKPFGISYPQFQSVSNSFNFKQVHIDLNGVERSADAKKMFSVGIGLLTYLLLLFYGVSIMRSVFDEKNSKIIELILSSITTKEYLFGKIGGVMSAGLLQNVIWGISYFLLGSISRSNMTDGQNSIITSAITSILSTFSIGTLLLYLMIFIMGLFQFILLYAFIGAWAKKAEEAQQLSMFPMALTMLPFLLTGMIIKLPDLLIIKICSFFPFVSSQIILTRLIVGGIPTPELVAAISVNFIFIAFLSWFVAQTLRMSLFSNQKNTWRSAWKIFREQTL